MNKPSDKLKLENVRLKKELRYTRRVLATYKTLTGAIVVFTSIYLLLRYGW